jgi:hypothetical protein
VLQLFWTEYVMAVVQLSALITEFFQLLLDGPASYFEVKWNWIKCFVIIFFWMGFWDIWARVKNAEICASSEEACAQASVKDAHITAFLKAASTGWGQDKTAESCAVWASCAAAGSSTGNNGRDAEFGHSMYSLSLCFMWLRVLRLVSVNKDLGPLVVVVGRMGRDMCVFGVIWIVLLLAFSSALYGTMMHEDFSASRSASVRKRFCISAKGKSLGAPCTVICFICVYVVNLPEHALEGDARVQDGNLYTCVGCRTRGAKGRAYQATLQGGELPGCTYKP